MENSMRFESKASFIVKMAVLSIASFAAGSLSSQTIQLSSAASSSKKSTSPPTTIDELVISLRDQLDGDFLCWEESAIEKFWNIEFFSYTKSDSQSVVEKQGSFQGQVVSDRLRNYRIMSRERLKDGKLYRGVVVRFDRQAQESPEISHIRLFEVFGNPSTQKKMRLDIAPPLPGQEDVEIKRRGDFQNMYMEWSTLSPGVVVSASTGFLSQLDSLDAVKRIEGGCK